MLALSYPHIEKEENQPARLQRLLLVRWFTLMNMQFTIL